MTPRPKLSAKRLRELLDCDPATGTLRWRERPGCPDFNAQWAGKPAGKLDPTNGYLRLMIDGRHQYVHRMVWLHVKGYLPPKDLDHIDGDRTNCAISNLRPATKAESNRNRRGPPRSKAWSTRFLARFSRKFSGQDRDRRREWGAREEHLPWHLLHGRGC